MQRPIHVIGGGLAGLVASIAAAEQGAPVVLHEAGDRLGGRAGDGGLPGLDLGPHVLFAGGSVLRWVAPRTRVPLRSASLTGVRLVSERGVGAPLREVALLLPTLADRAAPTDEPFRSWVDRSFGEERARLLCQLAGLFTFDHDPGALSARFVWERYRRTLLAPHRTRHVIGGWSTLVARLGTLATRLGVEIRTGRPVGHLDRLDGPVIIAAGLPAASQLLGRELTWPGTRTALVDVALAGRATVATVADVRADLTTCCLVERAPIHGPGGGAVYQAQLGIAADQALGDGVARIEATLDACLPNWRDRTTWRRAHLLDGATGAVDPPGTTWHDRPAIDQGDGRFLAGDAVAAPGLLSEVSVNSAVRAAHLAVDARRHRAFSPGWPTIPLQPERRLAVLGAALGGAVVDTVELPASAGTAAPEPVDETGPGYRLRSTWLGAEAYALRSDADRSTVAWLSTSRLPRPLAACHHWLRRRRRSHRLPRG